jgi:hypothetical protein
VHCRNKNVPGVDGDGNFLIQVVYNEMDMYFLIFIIICADGLREGKKGRSAV